MKRHYRHNRLKRPRQDTGTGNHPPDNTRHNTSHHPRRQQQQQHAAQPPPPNRMNITNDNIGNAVDDIEEQLRVQRLKQKEQMRLTASTSSASMDPSRPDVMGNTAATVTGPSDRIMVPVPVLGQYTFDSKRKAYFPTVSTHHHHNKENDDDTTSGDDANETYARNPPPSSPLHHTLVLPHHYIMRHHHRLSSQQQQPSSSKHKMRMISYVVQLMHGTKQRRDCIATDWYGTLLLKSMSILPVTTPIQYSTPTTTTTTTTTNHAPVQWQDHQNHHHHHHHHRAMNDRLNHRGPMNDMGGSPLWTRTFDMVPFQCHTTSMDHDGTTIPTTISSRYWHRPNLQCLSYTTSPLIHGKILLPVRRRPDEGIGRIGSTPRSFWKVGVLVPMVRATELRVLDDQGQYYASFVLPFECNDFTAAQSSTTYPSPEIQQIVAGGNASRCCTIDLGSEEQIENRRPFHTKSDILCIESSKQPCSHDTTMTTNTESNGRPELIFIGHRNGLVQFYDDRTNVVQPIGNLSHGSHNTNGYHKNDVESVLRIQPLFRERSDQLLVRGRECWVLFDIRRMSGGDHRSGGDGSTNSRSRAATVHRVSLLVANSNSIPCKGMATDPMQSVVIVPFQSNNKVGNDCYGVNVWSLDSGSYVGQKTIPLPSPIDTARPIHRLSPSDIELSSTITPAWSSVPPSDVSSSTRTATCRYNNAVGSYYSTTQSYGLWLQLGPPYGMHHIHLPKWGSG